MYRIDKERGNAPPEDKERRNLPRLFGDYEYDQPLESPTLFPAEKNGFFRVDTPEKKID